MQTSLAPLWNFEQYFVFRGHFQAIKSNKPANRYIFIFIAKGLKQKGIKKFKNSKMFKKRKKNSFTLGTVKLFFEKTFSCMFV